MSKVFISYARDGSFGEELASMAQSQLQLAGYTVFRDATDLTPGDRWDTKLEIELETSDIVVLIVSAKVQKSEWVHNEISRAKEIGLPIIPILSERVSLPLWLRHLQTLDFSKEAQWHKLRSAIGAHLEVINDVTPSSFIADRTLKTQEVEIHQTNSTDSIRTENISISGSKPTHEKAQELNPKKNKEAENLLKKPKRLPVTGLLDRIALYKWTLTSVTVIFLLLTIIYTTLRVPIYRATTSLQIKPDITNFENLKLNQVAFPNIELGFYQTHNDLLKSRYLVKRVIEAMDLTDSLREKHFRTSFFDKKSDKLDHEDIIDIFLASLTIQQVNDSQLFTIHFDHPIPELAANIVNKVASEYMNMNLELEVDTRFFKLEALQSELLVAKSRVEESEVNLLEYAKENNILTQSQRDKDIGYRSLDRQVQSRIRYLDNLWLRIDEINYTVTSNNIQIIDQAKIPGHSYKPNIFFNLIISLITSLLIGFFILFNLRRKVKIKTK